MSKLLVSAFFLTSVLFGVSVRPALAEPGPSFSRVMIVIFENTDYADALRESFFAKLANEGALLKAFYAEAHPSQGNYIAMTSGGLNGVVNDDNFTVDVPHLGDLLEAKGLSWKVYAEKYPGHCFLGKRSGTYVRKHNPFISYKNVQTSPQRCAQIVEASQLDADINSGSLPDVSFYIPDLNNDGHDTGVRYANNWYAKAFGPRIQDPKFMKGLLLISTFDESGTMVGPNRIYTSLYGEGVAAGSTSTSVVNHYSVLKLIEDNFHLDNLGKKDATATSISQVWKSSRESDTARR